VKATYTAKAIASAVTGRSSIQARSDDSWSASNAGSRRSRNCQYTAATANATIAATIQRRGRREPESVSVGGASADTRVIVFAWSARLKPRAENHRLCAANARPEDDSAEDVAQPEKSSMWNGVAGCLSRGRRPPAIVRPPGERFVPVSNTDISGRPIGVRGDGKPGPASRADLELLPYVRGCALFGGPTSGRTDFQSALRTRSFASDAAARRCLAMLMQPRDALGHHVWRQRRHVVYLPQVFGPQEAADCRRVQ